VEVTLRLLKFLNLLIKVKEFLGFIVSLWGIWKNIIFIVLARKLLLQSGNFQKLFFQSLESIRIFAHYPYQRLGVI
jgi:hypothetical protein